MASHLPIDVQSTDYKIIEQLIKDVVRITEETILTTAEDFESMHLGSLTITKLPEAYLTTAGASYALSIKGYKLRCPDLKDANVEVHLGSNYQVNAIFAVV